ncbi:MAG: hypothetical protein RLZ98_866 [Pseudomonadota bacterium]|jgi:acylpyruvate hydrolase
MRFVTYEIDGNQRFGFLMGNDTVVDLEGAFAGHLARTLPAERAYVLAAAMAPSDALSFIEGGDIALQAAHQAEAFVTGADGDVSGPRGEPVVLPLAATRLLAPIYNPRNFIASGKNFNSHLDEMQQTKKPVAPRIPTGHPQFISSIVGPDAVVPFPRETRKLDYEVEMAVIIGRRGRNIRAEDALDYVFGYTIYNDLSARDMGEQEWGVPMLQKNLPGFSPIGPWIVTRNEIADLQAVGLRSIINGETRQSSTVANMRFKIPDQIAFWSQIGLEPGDIITTGTPGGVAAGRRNDEEPWWLKPGDVVDCEVDGIGTLRTVIGDLEG